MYPRWSFSLKLPLQRVSSASQLGVFEAMGCWSLSCAVLQAPPLELATEGGSCAQKVFLNRRTVRARVKTAL